MFLKREKPEMDDFEVKKLWFYRKNTSNIYIYIFNI